MEYDARSIWAFALIIAAALAYKYLPRWRAQSPYIDPAELKRRLDAGDDVVVLDVRTVGEFAGRGGHLPGAARALRDAGFTDVSVVSGGFRGWRRRGFPLEDKR